MLNRKDFSKLDEEIKMMEEAVFSNPSAEATEERGETVQEVVESKPEPKPNEEEETYKKRFINYKKSMDSKVFQLRQQVAELTETLAEYKAKVIKLESQKPDPNRTDLMSKFSEDDKALIGEETLTKLVEHFDSQLEKEREARVKEKEESLESEKKRAKQDRERVNAEFLATIAEEVPDYQKIDTDPSFHKWLSEEESGTGFTRWELFKTAQSRKEAHKVARYFKRFKSDSTKVDEEIEQSLTPVSSRAGSPVSTEAKKPDYVIEFEKNPDKFINEFYHDLTHTKKYRGKVGSERAAVIEDMITKAVMGHPYF